MSKKAVISNRIYLNVTPAFRAELTEELTYKIPPRMPGDLPETIKNITSINEHIVSIPVGRTDLIPKDYEVVDKRIKIPADLPEFGFELRTSQQEVYDDLVDNSIINAWVSWGKTFTALAIAKKLGQKTLVVVDKVTLRNQWIKEVEKVFGFSPGVIGSGRFEIDKPIVIGNTQSLYKRIDKVNKEFGTLILDEMHHVSSPTFSKIVDSSYARYKIGLSGTIKRKDGKHIVFPDYFSRKIYQPPKENYIPPTIYVANTGISFPDGASMPWAKKINKLCYNEEYIREIALISSYMAAKGHAVLTVSERVEFLETCQQLTGDNSVCIVGSTHNREELIEQVANGEKNVLYGSIKIFSEGISINKLSCLVLASPINNEPLLTQLIGRVIRVHPNKPDPVVVDVHLKGNTVKRQASNRMNYYTRMGYRIQPLKNLS